MRIEVKGRNLPVNEDLRDHVAKRFQKIAKQVSDLAVLEIEVSKERNLSDAIMALEKVGVKVLTAHNKSGRLEEAFLRLTSNKG